MYDAGRWFHIVILLRPFFGYRVPTCTGIPSNRILYIVYFTPYSEFPCCPCDRGKTAALLAGYFFDIIYRTKSSCFFLRKKSCGFQHKKPLFRPRNRNIYYVRLADPIQTLIYRAFLLLQDGIDVSYGSRAATRKDFSGPGNMVFVRRVRETKLSPFRISCCCWIGSLLSRSYGPGEPAGRVETITVRTEKALLSPGVPVPSAAIVAQS